MSRRAAMGNEGDDLVDAKAHSGVRRTEVA
jgi:hypothetical protein